MQTLWVDRMIGKEATIPDIELELQQLVQPTDLHCYEELSEEETETEEIEAKDVRTETEEEKEAEEAQLESC